MAQSMTTPAAYITPPISTKCMKPTYIPSSIRCQRVYGCHRNSKDISDDDRLVQRRNATLGLTGAVVLWFSAGDRNVYAAGRRPPPPPPGEKKDPNVSGVQAKVLASKKRKEAMKQAMAKLREKGKTVNEP